ncbi:MAG TPA: hypothetical protein VL200_07090 [Lacunisphaera sp.]|nr:hypothetical protein [Lacunisphaera sp.]
MSLDVIPDLNGALRPSGREVSRYARLIRRHEHRPPSASAACRYEAELHLWAVRSLEHERGAERAG